MDKIIEKWKPIMVVIGTKEVDYELVANYAEQHTNNQAQYATHESHNENSILPISLKILHKLLEKNLRIELSNKPLDLVEILSISK